MRACQEHNESKKEQKEGTEVVTEGKALIVDKAKDGKKDF